MTQEGSAISAPTDRAAPGAAATDVAVPVAAVTPAVLCAGLTYRFGTHTAVSGLDLEIAPGETFGLLGPNGAGKTTTIRMLTTLLKPMEGSVAVFGVSAAAQPMIVRRVIGYVPQLLSADATLTGRENVELFARLFDVPRKVRADHGLGVRGARPLGVRRVAAQQQQTLAAQLGQAREVGRRAAHGIHANPSPRPSAR